MTDFMEQKFGTVVTFSEWLIHMADNNRLSPGALHQEALIDAVYQRNRKKQRFTVFCLPAFRPLPHGNLLHLQTWWKNFCVGAPHTTCHTTQPDSPEWIHSAAGPLQLFRQRLSYPVVGVTNMIAVGHSQSYQLLSSTDLQSCNKMGETYFCKGRNVLLMDLT